VKRILVTGWREWVYDRVVRDALLEHGPGLVVHGDARGLDRVAARVAIALGWPTPEAHPADWDRHGPPAGGRRNQLMVDLGADVCLAFPGPTSTGTWDCVRRARAAGIPVVVYDRPQRLARVIRR
jgi:hypothetical protein